MSALIYRRKSPSDIDIPAELARLIQNPWENEENPSANCLLHCLHEVAAKIDNFLQTHFEKILQLSDKEQNLIERTLSDTEEVLQTSRECLFVHVVAGVSIKRMRQIQAALLNSDSLTQLTEDDRRDLCKSGVILDFVKTQFNGSVFDNEVAFDLRKLPLERSISVLMSAQKFLQGVAAGEQAKVVDSLTNEANKENWEKALTMYEESYRGPIERCFAEMERLHRAIRDKQASRWSCVIL